MVGWGCEKAGEWGRLGLDLVDDRPYQAGLSYMPCRQYVQGVRKNEPTEKILEVASRRLRLNL